VILINSYDLLDKFLKVISRIKTDVAQKWLFKRKVIILTGVRQFEKTP
jgi:hypothetical protein